MEKLFDQLVANNFCPAIFTLVYRHQKTGCLDSFLRVRYHKGMATALLVLLSFLSLKTLHSKRLQNQLDKYYSGSGIGGQVSVI